ncbi:MAG: hypothetical protein EZS28_025063 [Streblomastix strix]|uniref:Uncharacterized protein n=1 Tax=Streblomastix strix TaxID=222440 RepID=A0A5J4VAB7_9EUKA|nr:MAG: hypothetical protein EZS28_025063 [Streblomastix strix]
MKKDSAYILGTICRMQNLDSILKKHLVKELKKCVINETDFYKQAEFIEIMLCLAYKKANISEIVSDNFIPAVYKLAYNPDEFIQSNALNLLLIFAEYGSSDINQQVRQTVSGFALLEIIGTYEIQMDQLALQHTVQWNNNDQLSIIYRYIQMRELLQSQKTSKQKESLTEDVLNQILIQLQKVNEQISKLIKDGKQVPSITIGLINSVCAYLSDATKNNKVAVSRVMKTQLPKELVKLLSIFPIKSIKGVHNLCIFNIALDQEYKQQIYKLGTVQALSRGIVLPSTELNVLNTISMIHNVIIGGLQTVKSNQPAEAPHPYFEALNKTGVINQLEKCASERQYHTNISLYTAKTLAMLYKGQFVPPNRLHLILAPLNKSMIAKIRHKQNLKLEFDSVKFILFNKENHNAMVKENILQTMLYAIQEAKPSDRDEMLILVSYYFEYGNSNMRENIRISIPEEYIRSLVYRQRQSILFCKIAHMQGGKLSQKAIKDFLMNESIFALLVWYVEEQKMDQLIALYKSISEDRQEKLNQKNQKNKQLRNVWDKLNRMTQIVDEMRDREMGIGSMMIVRNAFHLVIQRVNQKQNEAEITQAANTVI